MAQYIDWCDSSVAILAQALNNDRQTIRGHHALDRIPNFSAAGYGDDGLPDWQPATTVLSPFHDARDRTADIQHAIDRGGVVELADGVYPLHGSIRLLSSSTILRGSRNTLLEIQGSPRTVISIGSDEPMRPKMSGRVKILDAYVPVGADRVRVDNPRAVKVGARVFIERKVTAEWLHRMGMDRLVRNGQKVRQCVSSSMRPANGARSKRGYAKARLSRLRAK
jgi:hypothetical protein